MGGGVTQPQPPPPHRLRTAARVAGRIVAGLAVVGYPAAVYAGLTWWSTRAVAAVVLAMVVPSAILSVRRASRDTQIAVVSAPLGVVALVLIALATDDARFILVMPVMVNAVLFVTFARTLAGDVSMIERYAQLVEPNLSQPERAHCRQVTQVWCGFFILNGAAAGGLAAFAPTAWWALYTGLLSYGLMGALFVAEFIVRKARFRRHGSGLHDRVFARIFPPHNSDPQP